MELLNSLIIEGTVGSPYVLIEQEGDRYIGRFTLEVKQEYKNQEGKTELEACYFNTELSGNYAKRLEGIVKKGLEVRIVGKLKQAGTRVIIAAEHIEFKLFKGRPEGNQEEQHLEF